VTWIKVVKVIFTFIKLFIITFIKLFIFAFIKLFILISRLRGSATIFGKIFRLIVSIDVVVIYISILVRLIVD
jgi:hypothetical protein